LDRFSWATPSFRGVTGRRTCSLRLCLGRQWLNGERKKKRATTWPTDAARRRLARLGDAIAPLSDRHGVKHAEALKQALEGCDALLDQHIADAGLKKLVKDHVAALQAVADKLGMQEEAGYKKSGCAAARGIALASIQACAAYALAKAGKLPAPTAVQSELTDKLRACLPFEQHMTKAAFAEKAQTASLAGVYPVVERMLSKPRCADWEPRGKDNAALAMGLWEGVLAAHKDRHDAAKRAAVQQVMQKISKPAAVAAAVGGSAASAPGGAVSPPLQAVSPLPSPMRVAVAIAPPAAALRPAQAVVSAEEIGAELYESLDVAQLLAAAKPLQRWLTTGFDRTAAPLDEQRTALDRKLDFLSAFESPYHAAGAAPDPYPVVPNTFKRDLRWWGVRESSFKPRVARAASSLHDDATRKRHKPSSRNHYGDD